MLDGNWRDVVDRGLTPIGRSLQRTGISADVVTVVGIAMATAAAVSIGLGYLRLGFLLLVLTGIPDALDGAVAKAAGTSSQRGAYFDSVADRLTDALLFGGVAWHLAEHGRLAHGGTNWWSSRVGSGAFTGETHGKSTGAPPPPMLFLALALHPRESRSFLGLDRVQRQPPHDSYTAP